MVWRLIRRATEVVTATALLLAPLAGLPAMAQCLPGMCKFTESGKKGRYIDTDVDTKKLAKNDDTIKGDALFAAQSVNRGELAGTGLKMPQTEQQIVTLIDRFRPHWKFRQPPNLRVRIVGTNSFNPQTFADGVIVVPFGILYRAQSDDQVAWLLAHEFSHLALAHFASEARRKKRDKNINAAFHLIQTGVDASQMRADKAGGTLRVYEVQDPAAQAASESIFRRSRQVQEMLSLLGGFFSRSQEDQADVLGMDLAVAAGFSEEGAGESLDILAQEEESVAQMTARLKAALANYAGKAANTALKEVGDGGDVETVATKFLKSVGSNGLQMLANGIGASYRKGHRPAAKRKEGVAGYFGRAYKNPVVVSPSTKWLDAVRATAEYKDAFIAVMATQKALTALDEGKAADAASLLRPAFATRYAPTPLVANASAKIADRRDQLAEADRLYSIAARIPANATKPMRVPAKPAAAKKGKTAAKAPAPAAKPTPLIVPPLLTITTDTYLDQTLAGFGEHVDLLVRMKNYGKALFVIKEAARRFKDDESFLPAYIAIYMRNAQFAIGLEYYGRCQNTVNTQLWQKCYSALFSDDLQAKVDALDPADKAKLDFEMAKMRDKAGRTEFWSTALKGATTQDKEEDDKD